MKNNMDKIVIKGARQHNLKNINIEILRNIDISYEVLDPDLDLIDTDETNTSDIELNGRNISLVAQQNIYLNAGKNIKTFSGADTEMVAGADFTVDATKELFLNGGGAVGIHCESEVIHTSSGTDEFMAPDFYQDITPFHDESPPALSKIDSYNQNDG